MNEHERASEVHNPTISDEGSLRRIEEALRGVRYGSVAIIIQDGVIVQIDRTEKVRLVNGNYR